MKTAQEIYDDYNIMLSLQLHQLRVAAMAKLVCENFKKPIDTHAVVLACLFHDMGNIIKSDLSYFPEFVEPEGRAYWEKVKAEFVSKYGADHHAANTAIARELRLSQNAYRLLDGLGFSKLEKILLDTSDEQKICEYADLRVGPKGVLSLKERLNEGRARYLRTRNKRPHYDTDDGFKKLMDAAKKLETQVMSHTSLTMDEINDGAIMPLIEELRNYPVA